MLKAEDAVSIPYHPSAALAETIFVLQDPREPISTAYEMLGRRLTVALTTMQRRGHTWGALTVALATGQWKEYHREAATWLPQARLLSDEHHPKYEEAALHQFATAATVFAAGASRSRHPAAESTAIGAAISALRLKSDAPFMRIWSGQFLTKSHEPMAYWARLIFMQLRVLGTLPQHKNAVVPLEMLTSRHEHARPYYADAAAVLIYADALGVIDAKPVHPEEKTPDSHEPRWWFFRDEGEELNRLGAPKTGKLMSEVIGTVMRLPSLIWLRSDFPDRLRALQPRVWELSERAAEELQGFGRRAARNKLLPQALNHYNREYSRGHFLGTWPLPLVLSVISLVRGPEAIDEVLAWVNLCRLFHGYAWRVLVDWRHLAHVRTHPKFVAFMKQDDEQTEKIEAAIDRGRYPL
jgi:hypothetical protein